MSTNNSKSRGFRQFQRRLFNSRFFTVSVLIHFIFVLTFGGTVLFNKYVEPPDFTGDDGGGFVSDSKPEALPPDQEQPPVPTEATTMTVPVQVNQQSSSLDIVSTVNPTNVNFTVPTISTPTLSPTGDLTKIAQVAAPKVAAVGNMNLTAAQARDIKAFTSGWVKGGSGGVGSSPRQREFLFTAYLAKYGDPSDPARGGDWASTNEIRNGKITKGSLSNLLYYMNKMSRDKIHANPDAVPLDLSSNEIFAKKPPFIFFTGHRNFVLTDKEVANLQKYIRLGGCIWGDSSLPGRHSRFDLAFRREMRRIIPDADKDWEVLPPTHPMFTKNLYYPEIKAPPAGINFYQEPVYALKFAGEVAILYTANDYGDMWQIGLNQKGEVDLSRDEFMNYVATNMGFWLRRGTYFRNLDQDSLQQSYKFGTNVVIHLLTRWEDRLKNVPTGL